MVKCCQKKILYWEWVSATFFISSFHSLWLKYINGLSIVPPFWSLTEWNKRGLLCDKQTIMLQKKYCNSIFAALSLYCWCPLPDSQKSFLFLLSIWRCLFSFLNYCVIFELPCTLPSWSLFVLCCTVVCSLQLGRSYKHKCLGLGEWVTSVSSLPIALSKLTCVNSYCQ